MRMKKCKHAPAKLHTLPDPSLQPGQQVEFNKYGWYCKWCKIPLEAIWKAKAVSHES